MSLCDDIICKSVSEADDNLILVNNISLLSKHYLSLIHNKVLTLSLKEIRRISAGQIAKFSGLRTLHGLIIEVRRFLSSIITRTT
jgi:hypothetical protein